MNTMQCSSGIESGSHPIFNRDIAGHIAFDSLMPNDRVIIETANSVYRFIVTDPSSRLGRLTGGAVGIRQVDAYLIESAGERGKENTSDLSGIRTGRRVLIYIEKPTGIERLITSPTTRLTLVRPGEDSTPIA